MPIRPPRPRTAATGPVAVAAALLTLSSAAPAAAQVGGLPRRAGFELRPFAGAYVPTGSQHDLIKDAFHAGLQGSYRIIPQLAVVGTLAWTPTKDRVTPGDQSLDVFHYDVGVEGRADAWLRGARWDFTPIAGVGLGGRTYRYRDLDADSQSRFTGYGALGGELGLGRVGVRVEARDYLSGFMPAGRRTSDATRNDVTLAAGLTVRF